MYAYLCCLVFNFITLITWTASMFSSNFLTVKFTHCLTLVLPYTVKPLLDWTYMYNFLCEHHRTFSDCSLPYLNINFSGLMHFSALIYHILICLCLARILVFAPSIFNIIMAHFVLKTLNRFGQSSASGWPGCFGCLVRAKSCPTRDWCARPACGT